METKMRKVWSGILAVILALSMSEIGFVAPAQAAQEPAFCGDEYQFMFSPEWDTFGLEVGDLSEQAKVRVKVSDKKAAKVVWDAERSVAWVTAKKPCTVKVYFEVKQYGKTYKHTTKLKWVKYVNPLKSLSVGKKKYKTAYFDKNTQAGMKQVKGESKVKVNLKKGYRLRGLGFSRGGEFQMIQNGDRIDFTKLGMDNTVLFVYYTDPKGYQGTLRLFVWDKDTTL